MLYDTSVDKVFNPFIIRGKVYTDISDYINKVKIKVMVPRFVLNLPTAVENEEIIPSWYNEIPPNELTSVYITTAECIELCHKRIMSKIVERRDLLMSYLYSIKYIEQLEQTDISTLPNEYQEYYKKIVNYRNCLKDILDRLCKIDHGLRAWLEDPNSISTLLKKYK